MVWKAVLDEGLMCVCVCVGGGNKCVTAAAAVGVFSSVIMQP